MRKAVINGSFDILHPGHLKLINVARFLAEHLLICIDSDRRIKELKGSTRPINNEYWRTAMLDAIKGVNEVIVFDSQEELENILKYYQADVMVKGSDYKDKPIIGSEYCREIVFVDRLDEYSTSAKIQDITSRG